MLTRPPRHPRASIAGPLVDAARPLVLAAALAATLAAPAPALADRALLIGLDDYAHITDLVGSSNDLQNMVAFTRDVWRFKTDEVKVLRDSRATRDGILSSIRDWLVRGTRPGDRVLLYYTGHGGQKPDQNGDEPDGFDEALLGHDARYNETTRKWEGMVIDDEIGALVDQLDGREVVILVDSCYSGTITRSLDGGERDPRYIKTPHLVEGSQKTRSLAEGMLVRGRSGRSVWSAASSHQEALVDIDAPEKQGVFTRRFIRGVRDRLADGDGDGRVTQRELYRYIRTESERYCRNRPSYCRTGLTPTLEAGRSALDADVASQFAGGPGGGGGASSTAVASSGGGRPSLATARPNVSERLSEKQSISEFLATRPSPATPATPDPGRPDGDESTSPAPEAPTAPATPAQPATGTAASGDDGELITLLVGRQEVSTAADGGDAAPDPDLVALLAPPGSAPSGSAGQAAPATVSTPAAPTPPAPPKPAGEASSSDDLVARLAQPRTSTTAGATTTEQPVSQSQLVALLSVARPTATRSAGGTRRVPLAVVAPDRGTAGGSAVVLQPPTDGHVIVLVGRPGQPLRPLTSGPEKVTRGRSLSLALPGGSDGGGHIVALLTKSRAAADRLLRAARDPGALLAALDGARSHDLSATGAMVVSRN